MTADTYFFYESTTSEAQSLAGPATTVSGSSSNWQQLNAPFRFDVPGDGQSTRFTTTPFLATMTNQSTTAATQAWLDDFSVTPLSTTYCYDAAGRMEEVRTPTVRVGGFTETDSGEWSAWRTPMDCEPA